MTEDPPTDTAEDGRRTNGLRLFIFGLVVSLLLLAAVSGLAITDRSATPGVGDTAAGPTAPAQTGVNTGAAAESTSSHVDDGIGEVRDPPEIAPPASRETPDEDDSPVERHENELVVTTLVLNSLLGLLVFAHRFAPRTIGRFLRVGQQRDDDAGTADDETYDDELLDDCDVVTHLLSDSDGQLPQSDIVDSTDWSKAKVSRLLDEMESDGEIVKIRLGRQNLICLDGCEPELSKPMPPPPEDGRSMPHPDDSR